MQIVVNDYFEELKEYERQISEIKMYTNADNEKIDELLEVLTKYVTTRGGTASGALNYVSGKLRKGEVLNRIIDEFRCEAMDIKKDWLLKNVVVIDGVVKGVIGCVVSMKQCFGEEPIYTINIGGYEYERTLEVYESQLALLTGIERLITKGIQVYNRHGIFKNAYEIIDEMKEKNMNPKDFDWAKALADSYCSNKTNVYTYTIPKNRDIRVEDVNILVPDKVVEVTFADGTKEKSVCQEPDVFSLETAIAICLSKKIMGGSSVYNNAVKRGVKVYEDKLKEAELAKAEHERIEKKRAKRLAYKERKLAKRKAQEREEKIEIQKEAYIRAMTYMNDASKNVAAN